MSIRFRHIFVALSITVSALVVPIRPAPAGTVAPDAQTAVRSIVFPVVGPSSYTDTFGACRDGCARGHEGTDIMAPKLTELVAARDATVRRVKTTATPDGANGNYVMLRDAAGWEYWYIHLNNDSPGTDDGANPPEWIVPPGLEAGATVVAGQLVGYVGDSGNAEWTAPHLHFEIHKPDGSIINPFRSLDGAPRLRQPVDSTVATSPRGRFVRALHHDFLGRPPSGIELAATVDRLASGAGRQEIVHGFAMSDEWIRALLDRYYRSTLGRSADASGRAYWTGVLRAGETPAAVAAYFYAGAEYFRRTGGTDRAWIASLYEQLLRRRPDESGLDHWHRSLASGASRAEVAHWFYGSEESRRMRVTDLYQALLGRRPDAGGLAYWSDVIRNGRDLELAQFLAASEEYDRRARSRPL